MSIFGFTRVSHLRSLCAGSATKEDLARLEKLIRMNATQVNEKLKALGDQFEKATKEIVSEIETLKASVTTVELPQETTDSLNRLSALAQALDDLNPDPAEPS